VIASFGQARLIKFLDGKYILRGVNQTKMYDLTTDEMTNQWFAIFDFHILDRKENALPSHHEHAVALLDGTFAIERPAPASIPATTTESQDHYWQMQSFKVVVSGKNSKPKEPASHVDGELREVLKKLMQGYKPY